MRGFAQRNIGVYQQPQHAVVTFQAQVIAQLDEQINDYMERFYVQIVAIATTNRNGYLFATVVFEEESIS